MKTKQKKLIIDPDLEIFYDNETADYFKKILKTSEEQKAEYNVKELK